MNRRSKSVPKEEHNHPVRKANPVSRLTFESHYVTRDDGRIECVKIRVLDANENALWTCLLSNPYK
jgi:hypothetical protein